MMPRDAGEGSWVSLAAKWLFGQDSTTVLLFTIVIGAGWGAYHASDVLIPQHIKALNDNAEKIAKEHAEEVKELSKLFESQSEKQHELIQRLLPRAEREGISKPSIAERK